METEFYRIITAISQFLEGLFFGFCIITLLALIVYIFYKKNELQTFIKYSVLVAKNLAIFYFVIYTISLSIYYSSKEFEIFSERATGPYAWAYWMKLLRPIVFCGLLQLFWIKKMVSKMRYVALIIFFALIMLLCSGAILEKFIIITTSYHRDYLPSDYSFNSNIILSLILYVFKFGILFNALVFISWVIRKEPKFK
ncbi:hypothetical protein WNY78_06700 [Psychroserpens sp. AS72]|uniref:hypothetical protein n=1 Tax=Psychroserpens sp. AS72 TaxID=3135775 RepID=UPI00316D9765